MPHHICFVTDEIYPGTRGGIGRLIHTTVDELLHSGWQVSVLLSMQDEAVAQFRQHAREHFPELHVYSVNELLTDLSSDENIPLWGFHFYDYHASYRIALALRRLCTLHQINAVEFNDYHGLGYVALKWRRLWGDELQNIPFWIRLHGTAGICLEVDDARTYRLDQEHLFVMEKYCLQHADGWMTPSQEIAKWYKEYYGCDDKPIVTATPAFEHVGAGNTHPRVAQSVKRLLFYGKLQHIKGVDILIQAGVYLLEHGSSELEFEIIGPEAPHPRDESYLGLYERLIPPRWRTHFHFRGPILSTQLEQTAVACDLAVVPSRVETFCLAAHELNWIGIPLVLNNIPAFRDFFTDGANCRTFDGTVTELTSVLSEIIHHPEMINSWQWNALDVVSKHRGVQSYEEALATFHPPASLLQKLPLVSFIVPYYNMHEYIDATIDSIIASTYTNWEAIIVDDGSPNLVAQQKFIELRSTLQADKRFRFVQKENGGLGSARNYGFTFAAGDFVLPLDSDDVITPDYLERAVRALNAQPDVLAVSCFVSYFADGQPPEQIIDYVIPYDLHPAMITIENRAGVACSVFRREVFERFQYNEQLTAYEDWDLWWQIAKVGGRAEVMPKILYRYRRRADSMFNTSLSRHTFLLNKIADRHSDLLHQQSNLTYHMLIQQVNDLRNENLQLRSGVSNRVYTSLRRIYNEAREIRESRTYRAAQLLRIVASPFRQLTRPHTQVNAQSRVHTVHLEVLASHNTQAKGTEVWFGGVRTEDSQIYLLNPHKVKGDWVTRNLDHHLIDYALVGCKPGSGVTLRVIGTSLALMFNRFPWAGRVRVRLGIHVQDIDLYAPEDKSGFQEYYWSGNDWQQNELQS